MNIPALDIEGDVHARLSALESYYMRVAQHGAQKDPNTHSEQIKALSSILYQLKDIRFHFNFLRMRHSEAIEKALAGEEATATLNYQEALLVDTIRDMHASIWELRRDRIERRSGKTVEELAAAQ